MEAQSLSEREHKIHHTQKEIERKQKQSKRERNREREHEKQKQKRRERAEDDDDEERRRKRRKKKRKRKEKEKGCSTAKCCRCLFKCSSLCFIVAILAGVAGCYFYFVSSDDDNIYGLAAWAVAVIAFVFAFMFWCKR